MVIYVSLPKAIYPPNKHAVYHPKMEEMVFPSSPILRHLANENCFFTISGGTKLSTMQKNVLHEWITKPVNSSHPVFEAASYLSSMESELENDVTSDVTSSLSLRDDSDGAVARQPASLRFLDESGEMAREEHTLADKKKKKKKKREKKKFSFRERRQQGFASFDNEPDLINLDEVVPSASGTQGANNLDVDFKESGFMQAETSSSLMF